ncbi:MAG: hypothetical protein KJZ79_13645 [Bryobacteraceae bacterium]|nr:hypothetical protein [Bryobacteraceae bacterium]
MVVLPLLLLLAPPAEDAAREEFLRYGEIRQVERLDRGVTASRKVVLHLHGQVHDAHLQTVDIRRRPLASLVNLEPGFTDSYKYNIAAYELDRLLGLEISPVCVYRTLDRQNASMCWWVDGVQMTEAERRARRIEPPDTGRHSRQWWRVRVFDQLISNTDRNTGNILYDAAWRLWGIDHTRAFRVRTELLRPADITHIDRAFWARLQALDRKTVEARTARWLSAEQIDGLMARRDRIVAIIEERIREKGEAAVLFEWPDQAAAQKGSSP